jgi:hypothetical protein
MPLKEINSDGLFFSGTNITDNEIHIAVSGDDREITMDNNTKFRGKIQMNQKITDYDGDSVLELAPGNTVLEHNKNTKFNQNIDFNNKEVSNLGGFDGKFNSSQIISSNRSGQAAPNNTLDKEIDDMLIDISSINNRTSGLTVNKIIRSNNAGILAPAGFDTDKIVRNDLSTQTIDGDINLTSGKRIKYNNVAIEISSADKLNKDFSNIGSNILPEANTHSSIARVLALNNGLDLKADKTGVVFTGDVSLNYNAITGGEVLVVDGSKKITSSPNLLMTQAERDKITNVPANTNTSLSSKANLSGATFTGDITLDNLTASKVLVLNGQKKITSDDGLLMTTAERNKLSNVPSNTNTSLSDGLALKANLSGATFTGDVRLNNLTANKVLVLDDEKDITTDDGLLMTTAERSKLTNAPTNTNTSLATKATLASDNTFTGNITINTSAITGDKPLMVDNNKQIKTSTDSFITSAQSTAITTNTSNISTITNNYIKKDGSVDFTGNILVPTLEVGTTGYTITKDGNNDLIFNIPDTEVYNFKINNSLIAKVDSGGIDLSNGKEFSVDGSALSATDPNAIKKNVDNQEIACNNFSFSAGDSGDLTLRLKADTDNSNEQDNPKLVLEQDGGGVAGIISMDGENNFNIDGSTNGITNTHLICGNNALARIRLKHGTSTKFEVQPGKNISYSDLEITSGNNLKLLGLTQSKFVKTNTNYELVSADLVDGDIPTTIARDTEVEAIYVKKSTPTFSGLGDGIARITNNVLSNSQILVGDLPSSVARTSIANTFSPLQTFSSGITCNGELNVESASNIFKYSTNNLGITTQTEYVVSKIGQPAINSLTTLFTSSPANTQKTISYQGDGITLLTTSDQTITGVKTFHGSKLKITGGAVPTSSNFSTGVLGITSSGFVEQKLLSDSDFPTNPTFTGTTTIPTLRISDRIEFEGSGYVAFNDGAGNGNMLFDIPSGKLFAFRIGDTPANHALIYADGIKAGPNKKFVDSDGGFYPQAAELATKASPTFTGTITLPTSLGGQDKFLRVNSSSGALEGAEIFPLVGQSNNDVLMSFGAGDGGRNTIIWQINSTDGTDDFYGFKMKYNGQATGNDNSLSLISDNQNGGDREAYEVNQDGRMIIKQPFKINVAGGTTGNQMKTDTSAPYRVYSNNAPIWESFTNNSNHITASADMNYSTHSVHSSWQPCEIGYQKYIDPSNGSDIYRVYIRGLAVYTGSSTYVPTGDSNPLAVIANTALRPSKQRAFSVVAHITSGVGGNSLRVDIQADGKIVLMTGQVSTYVGLGGIEYWTH